MRYFGRQLVGLLVLSLRFAALAQPASARPVPAPATFPPTPESLGFRRLVVRYQGDSVQVLLRSPPGQETARLPLLLWAQGSLPRPLILYDADGAYPVVPFLAPDAALPGCHLAIIGKPGIPLAADRRALDASSSFTDKRTHLPPAAYCQRNHLDYYVRRDAAVLRYLKRQSWVDKANVTVAGHSEGSAIVARLASLPGLVSRAIYLSGSPLGRELSKLARDPADSTGVGAEAGFAAWQRAVEDPASTACTPGDSPRNIYSFGQPLLPALLRARVPIFVAYGTRDAGAAANDYLRLEAIRRRKTNFTFRAYPGREHNFFRVLSDGRPDYAQDYWVVVSREFLRWAGLGE